MALDRSRSGEYKVYRCLEDFTVEYKSIFGTVFTKNIRAGSKVYQGISYHQLITDGYFTKPTGNGGVKVGKFAEIENNPERFQYITTKIYDYLD